jgi:catechol 2,3-dioxygenase-like lactoylglutathione lyase family enzyme
MAAQRYRNGPSLPTLDHVQVAAPPGCEAAARAFYGELLGLSELDKPAALRDRGGVWFALGAGAQLHIGVAGDGFVAAAKAHPALRAPDADELRAIAARLRDAGAPVRWPPADEMPGVVRFFTADPWGNRLELLA